MPSNVCGGRAQSLPLKLSAPEGSLHIQYADVCRFMLPPSMAKREVPGQPSQGQFPCYDRRLVGLLRAV